MISRIKLAVLSFLSSLPFQPPQTHSTVTPHPPNYRTIPLFQLFLGCYIIITYVILMQSLTHFLQRYCCRA